MFFRISMIVAVGIPASCSSPKTSLTPKAEFSGDWAEFERLAKRIAGWLQEDAAIRQLRRVPKSVRARLIFFVAVDFQAGGGDTELEGSEVQPVLNVDIGNPIK